MAGDPGRLVLIKVDISSTWVTIGYQKDAGLDRGTNTADSTHKEDDGAESSVPTTNNWNVSCEGAFKVSDAALAYLRTKWRAKEAIKIKIDRSAISDESEEGDVIIEAFNERYPINEIISYTATLKGSGTLAVSA